MLKENLKEEIVFNVENSVLGKKWVFKNSNEQLALAFSQRKNLTEILGQVLAGRNTSLDHIDYFLDPKLKYFLEDPFDLLDMKKATARIVKAIKENEKIAIFGDYDVDGATSSSLLYRFFENIGISPIIYIPDRQKEGYGPNTGAFHSLKEKDISVVITVDCGTTAFDPIKDAKEMGIDVIVIDHHVGEPKLPLAHSVINPNRLDETSPYGYLAAVGVSFLFLVALNKTLREENFYDKNYAEPNLIQWLDLVALGTVCDLVPLKDLNRAFVRQGLKIFKLRNNLGVKTLSDTAQIKEEINTYHLGFILGPRVNAGGRVGQSFLGAKLLTTRNEEEAISISQQLDHFNKERKEIEEYVLNDAIEQIQSKGQLSPFIIVANLGWHPGVIGIVASRITERYNRPSFVIALEEKDGEIIGKGSGRSVKGFDIGNAVISARQSELLINGGGHSMAAGLTISGDKIQSLQSFLDNRFVDEVGAEKIIPYLEIDASLSIGGAHLELLEQIEKLSPFGMGNPEPKFVLNKVHIEAPRIIGQHHIKCLIRNIHGEKLQAIAFRCVDSPLGDALLKSVTPLHVAGILRINKWQGIENPQFQIQDVALIQ